MKARDKLKKMMDSFEESLEKGDDKPFHGYNKERHSRTGGLSTKAREKYNRETGSNLKAPVTEKNPTGKKAARKKSFCARMKGVKGPTSKDGKLTPKGAALKRWRCSKCEDGVQKALDHLKEMEKRCWDGYEPVPGKEPYSKGSCRPKSDAKKSDSSEGWLVKPKSDDYTHRGHTFHEVSHPNTPDGHKAYHVVAPDGSKDVLFARNVQEVGKYLDHRAKG